MCVCVCRALCYLTLKQYGDAVRDCDEALMMDGCNIKALYRRAQALRGLKVREAAGPVHLSHVLLGVLLGVLPRSSSQAASSPPPPQEVTACVEDLNKLLRLEPKNTAALKLLQDVQNRK